MIDDARAQSLEAAELKATRLSCTALTEELRATQQALAEERARRQGEVRAAWTACGQAESEKEKALDLADKVRAQTLRKAATRFDDDEGHHIAERQVERSDSVERRGAAPRGASVAEILRRMAEEAEKE